MPFNSKHKIDTGLARKLHKNWLDTFPSGPGPKDTKAIWFDRDILEEALSDTPNGERVSGLRFYMAAYHHDHNKIPSDPAHRDKVTLVFVQTKLAADGKDSDHKDILEDPTALPQYPPEQAGVEPLFNTYNDGQLCPPGKGCDTIGLGNFPYP